jgi:hypothetical protein
MSILDNIFEKDKEKKEVKSAKTLAHNISDPKKIKIVQTKKIELDKPASKTQKLELEQKKVLKEQTKQIKLEEKEKKAITENVVLSQEQKTKEPTKKVEEKKAVVKTVDVVEELGYFELHPGTF